MKIKDKKLRELIIHCTYNIKGLSKASEIRKLLPIKYEKLEIYEESNMLIFNYQENNIGKVLMDNNLYSNIEILKVITPIYGVRYKGIEILDLMKYRNNIIAVLI